MRRKFVPGLAFQFLTPLYDKVADLFGLGTSFHRRVLAKVMIHDGGKLLDIGCGSGTLLIQIKSNYPDCEIIGTDPDLKMLHMARSKAKRAGVDVELAQGLAQKLPFASASLDFVTSTLAFHHLPTKVKKVAIKEIYRTLKDGGVFLLADFGRPRSRIIAVLWELGSIFGDGRENLRANLRGWLPVFLQEQGFQVSEMKPGYRSVQFLLARK